MKKNRGSFSVKDKDNGQAIGVAFYRFFQTKEWVESGSFRRPTDAPDVSDAIWLTGGNGASFYGPGIVKAFETYLFRQTAPALGGRNPQSAPLGLSMTDALTVTARAFALLPDSEWISLAKGGYAPAAQVSAHSAWPKDDARACQSRRKAVENTESFKAAAWQTSSLKNSDPMITPAFFT